LCGARDASMSARRVLAWGIAAVRRRRSAGGNAQIAVAHRRPANGSNRPQAIIRRSRFERQRFDIALRRIRAGCFWLESMRDSRIGQILIQPVGWAEASRNAKAIFARLA
jgi:hypothetical protein